jgi:hypothetical protein
MGSESDPIRTGILKNMLVGEKRGEVQHRLVETLRKEHLFIAIQGSVYGFSLEKIKGPEDSWGVTHIALDKLAVAGGGGLLFCPTAKLPIGGGIEDIADPGCTVVVVEVVEVGAVLLFRIVLKELDGGKLCFGCQFEFDELHIPLPQSSTMHRSPIPSNTSVLGQNSDKSFSDWDQKPHSHTSLAHRKVGR